MEQLNKYGSTKFIITILTIASGIVLLCKGLITGAQLVTILEIIIPAYFTSNVVASHSAFKPPIQQLPDQSITEEEPEDKEEIIDRLKHGG